MVHFKIVGKNIYAYDGDKYLTKVGRADNTSYEKLNYIRRKYEGKVK